MEGSDLILQSLGDQFQRWKTSWEEDTNVPFTQIAQLTVGLVPHAVDPPRPVLVAELNAPGQHPDWWPQATPSELNGKSYRARGKVCYYAPSDESGHVLVVSHASELGEIIEADGASPILIRPLQQALSRTDGTRHFNLVCVPNFLYADGRALFEPMRGLLRDQIHWLVGDQMQAATLSMHWDQYWYVELGLSPRLGQPASQVAQQLREKSVLIPTRVEAHLAAIDLDPYWQRLALRFPQMIGFVCDYVQIQAHKRYVQANAVLPVEATHNLVLASDLAVQAPLVETSVATSQRITVKNVDALLDLPTTFAFGQLSLEFALEELQEQVERNAAVGFPFSIELRGGDLESEGITRNQQIRDFNVSGQPFRAVLTELLIRANPVPGVIAPNDSNQKLVWYVEKATGQVHVSVRSVCAERGIRLPKEFLP